jgi:hypothetical protein
MTYRLLDVSEWPLIEHEFLSRGYTLPDPKFAMIAAAFTEQDPQTIDSFLVCQLQLHFEPLVLKTPMAIRGLFRVLEQKLIEDVGSATYYSFAGSDTVAGLAEAMGMAEMKTRVYLKSI